MDRLLNTPEAAKILGLTPQYLKVLRLHGDGPPFVKVAHRAVRYRPSDLEEWIAARTFRSTSEVKYGQHSKS